MRLRRTLRSVSRSKQRFLVALLSILSASGCAGFPDRFSPGTFSAGPLDSGASDLSTPPQKELSVATGGTFSLAAEDTRTLVQPVAFRGELAVSAPMLAFTQESSDSSAVQINEASTQASQQTDTENTGDSGGSNVDGTQSQAIEVVDGSSGGVVATQQPVEYFVSIALAAHPKIQAARQRVAAATNVAPQVSALPDPMFNNTFLPIQSQALQTAGGRVGHQFGLSQGVPWPEKRTTKAAIANREVQMAQSEVERIEREITESVRLAYYEVWFSTRAIAIIKETRDLVDDLTQVAEARYKSGGSQQDVLRAQLEADRLDDQLVTLRKQKQQSQADLAALVQQPVSLIPEASAELGLTNVPEQLDGLLVLAEQCSPELRAIAWEIQRDRQKHKLACLQKYPDLQFGLNYSIISDNNNVISPVANGHDNISFTVGTTLPIWRDKINAGVREAAHRTSSSSQRYEAERDAIQGKLRRLMAQADAIVEQQAIYTERIIPRTEDTLKLSIADYRGKRTDFFTLIETYRELLMFETQLARFQATLAGTVAQIERTVGCPQ